MEKDKTNHVQKRAYELWEQQGRPDGKHEEHWKQAEQEFSEEEGFASGPSSRKLDHNSGIAPRSKGTAKRRLRGGSV
ncbi:DUF2934 domain-containing protein [Candidatus Phyllobacterium onerii]|uniref:DUF2934 domain-containing protein n=1 Tax=Candidatus Phyllobacterium onerii TaxID=3020828 RepID=UPI00232DD8A3|nr:DUF2934 domain-containing protein [Phyllobacterium sp. IY22]